MRQPVEATRATGVQGFQEFKIPASWQVIDFISDLHLQSGEPATFKAWHNYLQTTKADAVFMLGDLFEVWVGDDVAAPPALTPPLTSTGAPPGDFERECADVLRAASKHTELFFMHGNRDFLVGEAFLAQCGIQPLADPTVLDFGNQRWLLSHGDALCLADTDYQKFRAMVRSQGWQRDFLSQPLQQRLDLARGLRAQSEARKTTSTDFFDVDSDAAAAWLAQARAATLIHGHTHRPAEHLIPRPEAPGTAHQNLRRIVLSDWDASATPPRLEVLRLDLSQAGLVSRVDLTVSE